MAVSKKFQIETVKDRSVTSRVYTISEAGAKGKHTSLVAKEVTRVIPESFMVYFPGGHSVWFESREKMAAAGILEHANEEIDLDTGEPIRAPDTVDLKSLVGKRTQVPNVMRSL